MLRIAQRKAQESSWSLAFGGVSWARAISSSLSVAQWLGNECLNRSHRRDRSNGPIKEVNAVIVRRSHWHSGDTCRCQVLAGIQTHLNCLML